LSLKFIPHPLARALVKDDSYKELRENIKEHEQLLPVLGVKGPHNGDVLVFDGIRRMNACLELRLPIKHVVVDYKADELPERIAALNCQRWDQTPAQRAAYCVEYVLPAMMALAKERQRLSAGRPGEEEKGSARVRYPEKVGEKTETAGTADKGSAHVRYLKDLGKACERAAKICRCGVRNVEHLWRLKKSEPKLVDQVAAGDINARQAVRRFKLQEDEATLKREARAMEDVPASDLWRIVTGDNAKILPTLARRRFPLIVCDPQYNIGYEYGDGSPSDKMPAKDYLALAQGWIEESIELLTATGSMWIIINDEWAAQFKLMAEAAGLHVRSWVKWYETYGANCTEKFNRTSRHCFHLVRDLKRFTFHYKVFERPTDRKAIYNDKRAAAPTKLADDVWIISRVVTGTERMPSFPTQLPLTLVSRIVEGCSNPGDEVADFFSGSGTTGEAAVRSGRRYFGIEINPRYAELSRARLNRVLKKREERQAQKQGVKS
jgi:site-specific DNA-methyltransferase (adenine-specific)